MRAEGDSSGCCGGGLPGDAEGRRELVRERYSTLAASGRSCCGSAEETAAYVSALYSEEEIRDLPEEVRALAMGCGNPAALANLRPGG